MKNLQKTQVEIYRETMSDGGLNHKTLGFITLEREISKGKTKAVRAIAIDEKSIDTHWSEALIAEFFPEFTGYRYLEK